MSNHSQTNAGAVLVVDLDAICNNWRALRARLGGAQCAAVVKADAYGLGAQRVARALYRAGCRHFFVAHVDEAIALRPLLDADASLYALHGSPPGAEAEFPAHGVVPVLNSLRQLAAWRALAQRHGKALPAVLQVDTGMARLGLSAPELEQVVADAGLLQGV
ncbi:MAG: alanine racemase, partial [Betaproteobacteria bacterium HGW-Betaproteobacteria-19]